jgi:thiol-disulfide isomerase/thioredoxin
MNRHLNTALTFLLCGTLAMVTHAGDLQEYRENSAPPPLVLKDNHGQQHSLEDYRGKVVMVNFWAGWCHPCIQEIPEMIRLEEILTDRPFVILAVNVGEEQRKLPGFANRMDEHMVILMDTESVAFKRWKGIGLPSTFIIDTTGQIRYEAYGPVNWDAPYVITMLTELMDTSTTEAAVPGSAPTPVAEAAPADNH